MGVHAAHTAEALGVAAQTVIPQLHVTIRPHGHVHDLAVTGDIHSDLAIERAGELRQELHQLPREEITVLHFIVVQARQRIDHAVADARQVAMDFLLHGVSFPWLNQLSAYSLLIRNRSKTDP